MDIACLTMLCPAPTWLVGCLIGWLQLLPLRHCQIRTMFVSRGKETSYIFCQTWEIHYTMQGKQREAVF